jgi:hypothetical protein
MCFFLLTALCTQENGLTKFSLKNIAKLLADSADGERMLSETHSFSFKATWRVAWFLALELGFIIFASICLHDNVILSQTLTARQADIRGISTTLAIIWQTVAAIPIIHIITDVFSSEWSHVHKAKSRLVSGVTDRVSVQTANLWNLIYHTFTPYASPTFRVALLAHFLVFALHNLAPGVVSVSSVTESQPLLVSIGNITAAVFYNDAAEEDLADSGSTYGLSTTTAYLQALANYSYGFSTIPSNCAVGWPDAMYLQNQSSLTYPSDAMCWSHQCKWEAPKFLNHSQVTYLKLPSLPNTTWGVLETGLSSVSAPAADLLDSLTRGFDASSCRV